MNESELYSEVMIERIRQESLFPNQVLPYAEATRASHEALAVHYKKMNDACIQTGLLTWDHVLLEELHEAFAETDLVKMREELVQTAAVAFRIVAQIDRELDNGSRV